MIRKIDDEIKALRQQILKMGKLVEKSVEESTLALLETTDEASQQRLQTVRDCENQINALHLGIDEEIVRMIAQQSPLATDLRMLIATMKMNTDLERMGDQAMNITHCVRDYRKGPELPQAKRISAMAVLVRRMISEALDAFIQSDRAIAESVLVRDDEVDRERDQMTAMMLTHMKDHSDLIPQSLQLILIARNLERLGDHSTNIAEEVIYAKSGEDIRHGGGQHDKNHKE